MDSDYHLTWPRASTPDILGAHYIEDLARDISRPFELEEDEAAYTEDLLKSRLSWVQQILPTGKVPLVTMAPLTTHLISIYKAALKDLLTKRYLPEAEREDMVKSIMSWEPTLQESVYRLGIYQLEDERLMDQLCSLRRDEISARYGEYMEAVLHALGLRSLSFRTAEQADHLDSSFKMKDLNDKLQTEADAWRDYNDPDPSATEADIPTSLLVRSASHTAGLHFDRMRWNIADHADRDSLRHLSISELTTRGTWGREMADYLLRDLHDLPLITPPHLRHTIPILEAVINAVIDTYYDRETWTSPVGPQHEYELLREKWARLPYSYGTWTAGDQAQARRQVVDRAVANGRAVFKRWNDVRAPEYMSSLFGYGPWDNSGALGLKLHERRKKEWDILVGYGKRNIENDPKYVQHYTLALVEDAVHPDIWLDLAREDGLIDDGGQEAGVEEGDAEEGGADEDE